MSVHVASLPERCCAILAQAGGLSTRAHPGVSGAGAVSCDGRIIRAICGPDPRGFGHNPDDDAFDATQTSVNFSHSME
jgi:hypothetical protein